VVPVDGSIKFVDRVAKKFGEGKQRRGLASR